MIINAVAIELISVLIIVENKLTYYFIMMIIFSLQNSTDNDLK